MPALVFKADLLRKMMTDKRAGRTYRATRDDIRQRIDTNISYATLYRIEAGIVNPDVHTLGVLTTWLEVTPDHFYE